MTWNSPKSEAEKAAAWEKKFDEAFLPVDLVSPSIDLAVACEAAVPGYEKMIRAEFDRVAPPGSPQREQGIEVYKLYAPKVREAMETTQAIVDSFPPDEAYENAYRLALSLVEEVAEAILDNKLCAAECKAIKVSAEYYAEAHCDDGMIAIAHSLALTANIAERRFLEPKAKTPAPGAKGFSN